MKRIPFFILSSFSLLVCLATASAQNDEDDGFVPIFDGKSLEGWDGDPRFWRVENGTIVGESTPEKKVDYNTFLIWEDGEVDDFELQLEYRITAEKSGNSGIQTRSFRLPDENGTKKWRVGGYQSDFETGPTYSGIVYGEGFRGILALRGEKTEIGDDHKKKVTEKFAETEALQKHIKPNEWNSYHISFKGYTLTQKINGQLVSEMVDKDKEMRLRQGLLALQMHTGPPMKVEFRNIRLKRFALGDRKKVVFLPGGPSHGTGSHEHRAGSLLLAHALNENVGDQLLTTVYNGGWPKDPTALQNADAVVIYCDGGNRHMARFHLKQLRYKLDAGVGLGCIHYGVEIPKGEAGDAFLDWIGGYFETHWSVNPHWTAEFKSFPKHPVSNGLKPFEIKDEWYYHMRFRDEMKNVTPILSAIPPKETLNRPDGPHSGNPHVRAAAGKTQHLCWVSTRDNGQGRGFGFTGGHFHKNWADDNFRRTALNAITWIAGGTVPEGGVPSKTPTKEDLEANLDR